MFDPEVSGVFLSKVPDLTNPWKAARTGLYLAFLVLLCALFFFYADRLGWYAPLISQSIMALFVTAISHVHYRWVAHYRDQYGPLSYRYFHHVMLPYLVTWYACVFHPVFIPGPSLLPSWLSIVLGLFFMLVILLTSSQIELSGFKMIIHGMDVHTIYPKETTIVRREIYAYIRHPLYFALTCGTLGLGLLANNRVALAVALMQLAPALCAG